MGTKFFGIPMRVGLPLGLSIGLNKQMHPPASVGANIITLSGNLIVTLAGDEVVIF